MGICDSKAQTNKVAAAKTKPQDPAMLAARQEIAKSSTFNPQKSAHVIENKADINQEYNIQFSPILGEGAFGKVLLAKHNASGLHRAIKVIHKEKTTEESLEKIKREVRLITNLPNARQI